MPIIKFWRTTVALIANEAIANAGRTFKANAAAGAQTHAVVAPGKDGREIYVVKTDSSSNKVTLALNLDGVAGASLVLANRGDAVKLYDDGTTWTLLGNRPSAASLAAMYVHFDGTSLTQAGTVVPISGGSNNGLPIRSANFNVLHYQRGLGTYGSRSTSFPNVYVGPVFPAAWQKNDLWMKVA